MKTKTVSVTPDVAREYLARNTHNRALRPNHVTRLANAMRSSDWKETHQGIAFSVSGRLLDGQHRLHALIEAGVTLKMQVTEGMPDESFAYIDGGANRNVADKLAIGKREAEVVNKLTRVLRNGSDILHAQIEAVFGELGPEIAAFHAYRSKSTVRYFTSVSFRLAAISSILQHPDKRPYIERLYDNLANARTTDLPPVGHAIMTQVVRGSAGTNDMSGNDVLARGLRVFDPRNEKLTLVKVLDAANVIAETRAFYLREYPALQASFGPRSRGA